jgi:hypothetical protein
MQETARAKLAHIRSALWGDSRSVETAPCTGVISLPAIPLIYSVYLGIAEAARDIALERGRSRRDGHDISYLVGEMDNALATARFAHRDMLEAAAKEEPSEQATNRVMTGRAILARAAIGSVDKAMEVGRRRRLLSRGWARAPFSRRASRTLSSSPGKSPASLCRPHCTRPRHRRLRQTCSGFLALIPPEWPLLCNPERLLRCIKSVSSRR